MRGCLPDQTRLCQVHLRTRDLERAVAFYGGVLGLETLGAKSDSTGSRASVSLLAGPQGPRLLLLEEDPSAVPRLPRSTGLYHFALRYPSRTALAQAYGRVLRAEYPILGASDHGVSEAIYLSDPEGNGVELYADRPQAQWPREQGELAMVSSSLDLDALLGAARIPSENQSALPPELGHIHLHVASLPVAERFYGEFLGMAVTQRSYPGALFFAAGGYHHHVGVNVWAGKATPPAHHVGLVSYRLEVPVAEILYCLSHRAPLLGFETRTAPQPGSEPLLQIRDPNGDWLEVQVAPEAARHHSKSLAGCCEAPARGHGS